jgi:hypothetical protein
MEPVACSRNVREKLQICATENHKKVADTDDVCIWCGRGQLKCDGTRAETRFRLLAKRTSPFKSVGASVQSTTGSRGVRISGNNAGYTTFRSNVKGTGYLLHSPVFLSIPLPCFTVCLHVSTRVYPVLCCLRGTKYCQAANVVQRDAFLNVLDEDLTKAARMVKLPVI